MIGTPEVTTSTCWMSYVKNAAGNWSWVGVTSEERAGAHAETIQRANGGRAVRVVRRVSQVVQDVAIELEEA